MEKTDLQKLMRMAKQARGQIRNVYIHWTAGHHNQLFEHYHLLVGTTDVYASTEDLTERKDHTYYRNTDALGIALTCCYNADTNDLGPEPPTERMIEMTAQVIAVLSYGLQLPLDVFHFMTHAEAADNKDGRTPHDPYGPENGCERWDLWFLKNGDAPGTGGDILRGKAHWYLNEWGMAQG